MAPITEVLVAVALEATVALLAEAVAGAVLLVALTVAPAPQAASSAAEARPAVLAAQRRRKCRRWSVVGVGTSRENWGMVPP